MKGIKNTTEDKINIEEEIFCSLNQVNTCSSNYANNIKKNQLKHIPKTLATIVFKVHIPDSPFLDPI